MVVDVLWDLDKPRRKEVVPAVVCLDRTHLVLEVVATRTVQVDIVKLEPAFPEPLGEPRYAFRLCSDCLIVSSCGKQLSHPLLDSQVARGVEVNNANETAFGVENLVAAIEKLVERRNLYVRHVVEVHLPWIESTRV